MIKFLLAFALAFGTLFATEYKVVRIIDGDIVVLLTEKKEPGWTKSKQYLLKLIFGKMVELETHGKDKYRRAIAIIYLNGKDINAKMVKSGHAKAFLKYSKKYEGL